MFEKFLHQTPFFRLLISVILGIVFEIYFRIPVSYGIIGLCCISAIIIVFKIFNLSKFFILNNVWGILISLFLFTFGIILVAQKQQNEIYFENKQYTFIANITQQPEEKEQTIKTKIQLVYVNDSSTLDNKNPTLICYFEKDTLSSKLKLGDQIITSTYINEIKHTGNPFAFNYKKYLSFKEIYNQCYIQSGNYKLVGENKGNQLKLFSNKIRLKLLKIYRDNKINENEFAVLSALTLGYKSELTPELKESFSTSGAMHILAVSGLHVGIIYIILSKLLSFLNRRKYGKYVQTILIVSTLVFYAFLTGLSDSVLRATIMFTFISIGKVFTRQVSIYNNIAASAFLLLIINPYSVVNVGFQLSYAAVLSIVFFQPKIYSFLIFNNTIIDYLWQLISVSIAAQIGTFPITIFYFGQFPLYFIITNILIIPIATVIIYGAIILFIFSFSTVICSKISLILNSVTKFLNFCIGFIEKLPYAKIDSVFLDSVELVLWTITILVISFFIISKRLKFLRFAVALMIFIVGYNFLINFQKSQKSLFVVHHMNKLSGISLIDNKQAKLFVNQHVNKKNQNIQYNVVPLWRYMEITKSGMTKFDQSKILNCINFKAKRIVQIANDSLFNLKPKIKLRTDYIVLSNNLNISINQLNNYFNFKLIIFDSSNSYYTIDRWKKDCLENNISYYDVLNDGAYIENL